MRRCDICGKPVGPHGARGMCPLHYKRVRRSGDPHQGRGPADARFWAKVTKGAADACWEWGAGRDEDGYGQFWDAALPQKAMRAHRYCWLLEHGQLPPGAQVLHRCDNPPCVNPAHLFLGDNAANVADKLSKGRARGNETGQLGDMRRRLTTEQVEAIRTAGRPPRPYGRLAQIAREFGISAEHARRIINGTRRAVS